jgi:hypothetical protein
LAHFVPPQADETYISNIERDFQTDDPTPADSATSEPPLPADATPCNTMQHDSQNPDDDAPATSAAAPRPGLRSCRAPLDVLKACNDRQTEQTPVPKIENEYPLGP